MFSETEISHFTQNSFGVRPLFIGKEYFDAAVRYQYNKILL